MRISIHGNDKGNAVLISLTLILVFSFIFLSFTGYIMSLDRNVNRYRERVFSEMKETNREIKNKYDLD